MTVLPRLDLDRRLHAFRPDLADRRLEGTVSAERFSEGEPACVVAGLADLLREPRADAGLDTQLLRGARVRVFERAGGWAWVQAAADGYVGYLRTDALGPEASPPTHRVRAGRTFLYPRPDMKAPRAGLLSVGAGVSVTGSAETRGTLYARLDDGLWAVAAHLRPAEEHASDFVSVAEALLGTPYLWGGASAEGIDCSGLVQLSLAQAGRAAPRDTDLQEAALGAPIDPGRDGLARGDLVFWRGHVGIMTDGETLIHANGHTMDVSRERLADAVARIGYLYGGPTAFRRP